MKRKLFKKIALMLAVFALNFSLAAYSPSLDGRAVVVDEGVFPAGLFAKTVGYLPGDVITVTNINGDTTIDILVIGALDPSEGVAIMLSPEAADAIGLDRDANNIVKITKRSNQDERVYGTAVIAKQMAKPEDEVTTPSKPKENIEPLQPPVEEEVEEEVIADNTYEETAPVQNPPVEEKPPVEAPSQDEKPAVEEEPAQEPAEEYTEEPAYYEEYQEDEIPADEFEEEDEPEEAPQDSFEETPSVEETEETTEPEPEEEAQEVEEEVPAEEFTDDGIPEEFEEEAPAEEYAESDEFGDDASDEFGSEEETPAEDEFGTEEEAPAEEEFTEEEVPAEEFTDDTASDEFGSEEEAPAEDEFVEEETPSEEEFAEEEVPAEDEFTEDETAEDEFGTEEETPAEEEFTEDEVPAEDEFTEEETPVEEEPVEETPEEETLEDEGVIYEQNNQPYESIVLDTPQEVEEEETSIPEESVIEEPVEETPVTEPVTEPKEENVPLLQGTSYDDYIVQSLDLLKSDAFYIQISVLKDDAKVVEIINKYGRNYPITVVPGKNGVKQVLVGPLSQDEYGVVLERFKAYGYKDAFLKKRAVKAPDYGDAK